jgi:hypothetical protein
MVNIHGNRLLYDELDRQGSGYVARHGRPFLMANDPWFRGIMIAYGPDGGVFVSDWNDLGECHDSDGTYRSSGRLYKISYGKTKPTGEFNLAKLPDAELVKLQLHKNDWYVRHARRILAERAAAGKIDAGTAPALREILANNPDLTRQLRALWSLHAINDFGMASPAAAPIEQQGARRSDQLTPLWTAMLNDRNEHLRWWAIQFLLEHRNVTPEVLSRFAAMARSDSSPMVRLALASGMQRLAVTERASIAEGLLSHAEDTDDKNLPLMIWYGIEPLVARDHSQALHLLARSRIPMVREFIARRLASM